MVGATRGPRQPRHRGGDAIKCSCRGAFFWFFKTTTLCRLFLALGFKTHCGQHLMSCDGQGSAIPRELQQRDHQKRRKWKNTLAGNAAHDMSHETWEMCVLRRVRP